jgi:serpin B
MTTASAWNHAFTTRLYGELAKDPGNLAFSPASLQIALAMTWAGARGRTAEQMATALSVPQDPSAVHRALGLQVRRWSEPGDPLRMHQRVFVEQTFSPRPDFVGLVQEHYAAEIRPENFATQPQRAEANVNEWVHAVTEGLISPILPPNSIDPDVLLVLVNAALFKAPWLFGFDPKATSDRDFHLGGGQQVAVPTMNRVLRARHGQDVVPGVPGVDAVDLDYAGERFSLLVLVPPSGQLKTLERALRPATIRQAVAALTPRQIALALPRFTVSQTEPLRMKEPLRRLGMLDAFLPMRADLSGMGGPPGKLFVDNVYHRARIQVDEEGTVAAAASAVVVTTKSAAPRPLVVEVNRPFLFFLRDLESGAVAFAGRVVDPRAVPTP